MQENPWEPIIANELSDPSDSGPLESTMSLPLSEDTFSGLTTEAAAELLRNVGPNAVSLSEPSQIHLLLLNPSFVKNRRISEKTAFFPFEVGSSPGSLF